LIFDIKRKNFKSTIFIKNSIHPPLGFCPTYGNNRRLMQLLKVEELRKRGMLTHLIIFGDVIFIVMFWLVYLNEFTLFVCVWR